jgi:hypothetical protein
MSRRQVIGDPSRNEALVVNYRRIASMADGSRSALLRQHGHAEGQMLGAVVEWAGERGAARETQRGQHRKEPRSHSPLPPMCAVSSRIRSQYA